jgi:hypothetical protein
MFVLFILEASMSRPLIIRKHYAATFAIMSI